MAQGFLYEMPFSDSNLFFIKISILYLKTVSQLMSNKMCHSEFLKFSKIKFSKINSKTA